MNQTYINQTYKEKIQAAALGSHGARCPNGAACSTGKYPVYKLVLIIFLTMPKENPGAAVTTSNDIGEKAK